MLSMAVPTRQGVTFSLSRWSTVSGVLAARRADSIRRLASVVRTVTLVALRLCTLLTTTTLGLRCSSVCMLPVNARLTLGRIRTRPNVGLTTLTGLLRAYRPIRGAVSRPSAVHRASAPFELAGLATRITLPVWAATRR